MAAMAAGVWDIWSHGICSEEAERDECSCSASSLSSFWLVQNPGPKDSATPFQVGLPSSVKPSWKYPPRHTQCCVSMVVLNLVKLTRINHHKFKFGFNTWLKISWLTWEAAWWRVGQARPLGEVWAAQRAVTIAVASKSYLAMRASALAPPAPGGMAIWALGSKALGGTITKGSALPT